MFAIGIALTILLFISGIPIWTALSLGGIFLLIFVVGTPVANIPLTFYNGIDSFTLMAITFFLFAGAVMASCGPSKYIFDIVNSFFGRTRGGLAVTAVVMSMIYAAITGSSTATLTGVAEFCKPEMLKKGYSKAFIASLLAASCTLGQMIPPSILMILYASMVQQNTGDLFLSGIIPGILCGLMLCVMAWFNSPKIDQHEVVHDQELYSWKNRGVSLLKGLPALSMPIIVLGSIYAGLVTPTEAGGLAVVYSILLGLLYRKMSWAALKKTLVSTITSNSMIFILIAGALLFANPIAFEQYPQIMSNYIVDLGLNSTSLVFSILALFLLLGMFIDVIPILYLTIPVLYPALVATDINLIHFNVVMILAMQIGQISPPFGTALYVASGVCEAPVGEVSRAIIKYLIAFLLFTVVIILVPNFSLWLPNLLK